MPHRLVKQPAVASSPWLHSPTAYRGLAADAEMGREAEPGNISLGPIISCFGDEVDRSEGNGLVLYPVNCEAAWSEEVPTGELVRSRSPLCHICVQHQILALVLERIMVMRVL